MSADEVDSLAVESSAVESAAKPRVVGGDVVVAVDIGGTKMAVGLMTMQGELIDRAQIPVDHGLKSEELFVALAEVVDQQITRARQHHRMNPVAVGVGCAGPISIGAETVSPLNIFAWLVIQLGNPCQQGVILLLAIAFAVFLLRIL